MGIPPRPAHDQVIAIAVRPLAEQGFRWEQRLPTPEDRPLAAQPLSAFLETVAAKIDRLHAGETAAVVLHEMSV